MLVRGRKVLSGEKNSLALLSHLALSPLPPPPIPSNGITLEIPMQCSLPRRLCMEAGVCAVYHTDAKAYQLYIRTYTVRIHAE